MTDKQLDAAASATREALRRAFPDSIRSVVAQTVGLIPPPPRPELGPHRVAGDLCVDGERVVIPYRIYTPEPRAELATALDEDTALVLACCYTRHHDGYLREQAVISIIGFDRAWIVPFVIQLLGEYVVEIGESILKRLDELQAEPYLRFAAANESFMRLTRDHIVSYWARYNRAKYRLPAYPPVRVLMELGLWNGREGRRRLARGDHPA
jgi:hypothetical protein